MRAEGSIHAFSRTQGPDARLDFRCDGALIILNLEAVDDAVVVAVERFKKGQGVGHEFGFGQVTVMGAVHPREPLGRGVGLLKIASDGLAHGRDEDVEIGAAPFAASARAVGAMTASWSALRVRSAAGQTSEKNKTKGGATHGIL